MSVLEWILLAGAAFAASTVAAVTGTGGGILLLPVLVSLIGVRDAVPAYTLAQFFGNISRVLMNRRELRLEVAGWFVLGAVPAALAGSLLFARSEEQALVRALGVFLLVSVVWRRVRRGGATGFPGHRFVAIGAVFGVVSAYLGSAGPFLAPFFLSYGLVRGAYIGTEALGTAVMHVTKMATYGAVDVFSRNAVTVGFILAPIMVGGSWLGKRAVDRIPQCAFVLMVETILIVFGVVFLVGC